MATDDQQILVTGQAPAPAHFTVSGKGEIRPKVVFATYNGTGAATAFVPALKIVSDGGKTIGIYPTDTTVAAGGSADVSWFPGVAALPRSSAVLPGTGVDRHVTSQTVASGNATAVSFDSVLFDDLGWFNPVTPTLITPTIAGQFLCTYTNAWVYPVGGGFPIETGIDFNTNTRSLVSEEVTALGATPNSTSGVAVVNASAGDTFRLILFQSSGGNMSTWIAGSHPPDVQSFPTLSVIRIGDRV